MNFNRKNNIDNKAREILNQMIDFENSEFMTTHYKNDLIELKDEFFFCCPNGNFSHSQREFMQDQREREAKYYKEWQAKQAK